MFLILASFAAGLISFFSPCVIPLIPGFLAFLTGDTSNWKLVNSNKLNWYAFFRTVSFVAGFSFVFILMGLSASSIGKFLVRYQDIINIIGGAIIILFGLHILGLLEFSFLLRGGLKPPKYSSGFLLGVAFSAAWTPCVGPVLASILIIAGTEGSSLIQGVLLLGFYSLGIGIPFLLAALFWERLVGTVGNLTKIGWYLNKFAGVIFIILGFMIMTGKFTWLSGILA